MSRSGTVSRGYVILTETGRRLMDRQGGVRDAIHPDWRDDPEQLLAIVEKRIRELERDRDHLREILKEERLSNG